MKKIIKLLILIVISLSVLIIYKYTNNSKIKILNIGDGLSQGINSYDNKDVGYMDYYKEYLSKMIEKVEVNNLYSNKEQTISNILLQVKYNPQIRRDLIDAHILLLTLGYNDLKYKICIENNINEDKYNLIIKEIKEDYSTLIDEIKKYYKYKIIVVGYYDSKVNSKYVNRGIEELNNYLKTNKKITYIETYNLINNDIYFSNSNSYYPNTQGYKKISSKIINKTLEK